MPRIERMARREPVLWSDINFMENMWLPQYKWVPPNFEKARLAGKVFLHAYLNAESKVTTDQIRSSSLILINYLKRGKTFLIPWILPSNVDADDAVEVEDIFGLLDNPFDFNRFSYEDLNYKSSMKNDWEARENLETFVEWSWNGLNENNRVDQVYSVLYTFGVLALYVAKISTKPTDYISTSIWKQADSCVRHSIIYSRPLQPPEISIPPPNSKCWNKLSDAHVRGVGFIENIYIRCSYVVLVDQNDSFINRKRRHLIRKSIWDSMYMNGLQTISHFLKVLKKHECSSDFFIKNFCQLKNISIIKNTIERFQDGGPEEFTFGVSRLLEPRSHKELISKLPEILYFSVSITSVIKESFDANDDIWKIPTFADVNKKILADGITFGSVIYSLLKNGNSEEKLLNESGITINRQKSFV